MKTLLDSVKHNMEPIMDTMSTVLSARTDVMIFSALNKRDMAFADSVTRCRLVRSSGPFTQCVDLYIDDELAASTYYEMVRQDTGDYVIRITTKHVGDDDEQFEKEAQISK